jgi:hypothetical protein
VDGKGPDETLSEISQNSEYLNYGEEDEMEIEGYVRSRGKTILTWIFIILTAGLLRLIFHWWPRLMLYATHKRAPIAQAENVLVIVSQPFFASRKFLLANQFYNWKYTTWRGLKLIWMNRCVVFSF